MNATSAIESLFFDANKANLQELFVALDREDKWSDRPAEILTYTTPKWLGKDHGKSTDKDQFTHDQEATALDVLERMDMFQEVLPPEGQYEQVIVLGGLMRVNRQRSSFVEQMVRQDRVRTGKVVFWAGQRLRISKEDAELNAVNTDVLMHDDWVQAELIKPWEPGWNSRFSTETELSRLAFLENVPNSELQQVVMSNANGIAGIPPRAIALFRFGSDDFPNFDLLNGRAVQRKIGRPRPTTESCAQEWLELLPPSTGADILVVAGSPHISRGLREVRQVAHNGDRQDIQFSACGTNAHPDPHTRLYLALGEIGAHLEHDVRLLKNQSA